MQIVFFNHEQQFHRSFKDSEHEVQGEKKMTKLSTPQCALLLENAHEGQSAIVKLCANTTFSDLSFCMFLSPPSLSLLLSLFLSLHPLQL